MERRIIFPTLMFILAGLSFVYGTWQYLYARRVQASSDARLVHTITAIEDSNILLKQKERIYADIFLNLPPAPTFFGIEFSGSLAGQHQDDQCVNDGQRAVCRALRTQGAQPTVYTEVCGLCAPTP